MVEDKGHDGPHMCQGGGTFPCGKPRDDVGKPAAALSHDDLLSGTRIQPQPIRGDETAAELIENTFLAYNSARLREGFKLFSEKMLAPEVTVGMSLAGAMTPAGIGGSCIIPLIKSGYVDWIVSTGANLYHDLHFAIDKALHVGSHSLDDCILRAEGVVRIYDILFDYTVLLDTDSAVRTILEAPEFQREMGTAEFHYLLGKYAAELEERNGVENGSVLAAAYRAGVPVHTSSPGDSSIGMNVAAMQLQGSKLRINPSTDVNETASYVLAAKRGGGKSGVLLVGGGSPKNFVLQTEPQIQEVLGIPEEGHDYFFQITDARPDTGGLSGATPSEAVSWGKIDPAGLPNTVVAYVDSTIALPLLVHYALARHQARPLKRLYDRREQLVEQMAAEYNQRMSEGE